MKFNKTKLEGIIFIDPAPFEDDRGFFIRTFDEEIFSKNGIQGPWVQENHSKSVNKNILRGIHFILPPHTDGKIVRCTNGKIFDVVVDLRKDSSTFGQYEKFILSAENKKMLYIPKGFGHGFLTLTENCEVHYKHNCYYKKEYDSGIKWNDSDINIEWPVKNPITSEKDAQLMTLKDFEKKHNGL